MRIHRCGDGWDKVGYVVNCFQNTNFSEDSQEQGKEADVHYSCELLRILILVRIHRKVSFRTNTPIVVNCFQNTNFSEDSQG